jgi:hypothetical protein
VLISNTSISLSVLVSSTDSTIGFHIIPLACNLENFCDLKELSLVVVFRDADRDGTGDFCSISVDSSSISLLLSSPKSTPSFLILLLLLGCNSKEFVDVDERFLTVDLHGAYLVCTIDFRGVYASDSSRSLLLLLSLSLPASTINLFLDFLIPIVPLGFGVGEFLDLEESFSVGDFCSRSGDFFATLRLRGVSVFNISLSLLITSTELSYESWSSIVWIYGFTVDVRVHNNRGLCASGYVLRHSISYFANV